MLFEGIATLYFWASIFANLLFHNLFCQSAWWHGLWSLFGAFFAVIFISMQILKGDTHALSHICGESIGFFME